MILYFIIAFIGACILGAIVCGIISFLSDGDAKPLTHVIAFILTVSLAMSGAVLYINKSQSGIRLKKEYASEYHGGIKRELKVYSMNGTLLYEDTGKFDVAYDDGRIKYVDQHGKVKIIYLGDSASVVVKEIK